ncbi:hypothetical protein J2T57_003581 [Natronocella acetinitrilica]|uniref:Sulfotransferase n=1 Tax=Natronocella acetinitrilica TaxID=414046 RepID=A0AAE3G5S0_9GAMM|nr:sulfotransferase [Natronocella acetinitrilica]MCP1676420.1 hypothetical protein [Natronocella acetinitrilica]
MKQPTARQALAHCRREAKRARTGQGRIAWLLRSGAIHEQLNAAGSAEKAYRAALQDDTSCGAAWHGLSELGRLSDLEYRRLPMLVRDTPDDSEQRALLLFAIARERDRHHDSDGAFAAYEEANTIIAGQRPFDGDTLERETNAIKTAFSPDCLAQTPLAEPRGPIFIIGMPRSGTTLLHEMLAAHPALVGGGERDDLLVMAQTLRDISAHSSFAVGCSRLIAGDRRRLAAAYRDACRVDVGKGRRIVDKLPSNYLRAGMVAQVLPTARIIHTRRSPLDTCVSCFTTHFQRGQSFTYSLERLVTAYRLYERLMTHWRAALPPGMLHEVDYEALVREPALVMKGVLDHCGLPWDASCLGYFKNSQPVTSASRWQVREPPHQRSIGRWHRFSKHIGPLLTQWPDHDFGMTEVHRGKR